MNKISLLALALLASLSLSAQYVKVGPEAGVIYQSMSQTVNGNSFDADYQLGFKLGAVVDIEFNRNFFIQPGIFFKTNIGGQTFFEERFSTGAGLPASSSDQREYTINAVHIPIYLMYKTGVEFDDPKFFVGLAPYVDFNIGGRYYQRYTHALNGVGIPNKYDRPVNFGTGYENDFKNVNFGIEAAVGYEFRFGLFIKGTYGLGLLNMSPVSNGNTKIHTHGGGLTVGFLLVTEHRRF